MFKDSFSHGNWYPRWLPNMGGGYGYPVFAFYQPAVFYFALPFAYLTGETVHAFYYALFFMLLLGGTGAYKLARLYCGRLASLACAMMFYTTPYLALDLFHRSDLSELLATLLCPWAVYFLIKVADGVHDRRVSVAMLAGLIVTVACIIFSHPFVALFCIPAASLLVIGKCAQFEREQRDCNPRFILVILLCLLAAAILSCPYWLTVFQLKGYVDYQCTLLWQRLPAWWGTTPIPPSDWFGEYSYSPYFNPGYLHMTLAFVGFVYVLGFGDATKSVFFRYVLSAWLLLLFLMSDYSDFIWQMDTPLKYTQFPYRANSVAVTLQYMGVIQCAVWLSGYVQRLPRPMLRSGVWIAACVAILFTQMLRISLQPDTGLKVSFRPSYSIMEPIDYKSYKDEIERKDFVFMNAGEFTPVGADYKSLPDRLLDPKTHEDVQATYIVDFTYVYPDEPPKDNPDGSADTLGAVLIQQMYFPGW